MARRGRCAALLLLAALLAVLLAAQQASAAAAGAAAGGAPVPAPAPAGKAPTCALELRGGGQAQGSVAGARLACSGSIRASAGPQLARFNASFRGVVWDKACDRKRVDFWQSTGISDSPCLLTICDSRAVFKAANISGMAAGNAAAAGHAAPRLLCLVNTSAHFDSPRVLRNRNYTAIEAISGSRVTLADATFMDNTADSLVFARNTELTITHSVFHRMAGGVVHVEGGGRLVLRDSVFADNEATAVNVSEAPAAIERCTFVDNTVRVVAEELEITAFGLMLALDAELTITRSVFNRTAGGGRVVYVDVGRLALQDSVFADNKAMAVSVSQAPATIERCTFVNTGKSIMAVVAGAGANLVVTDSTFARNHANTGLLLAVSNTTVERCHWIGNSGAAGTVYFIGNGSSTLRIVASTFAHNTAAFGSMPVGVGAAYGGGAVWVTSYSTAKGGVRVHFINSSFTNNTLGDQPQQVGGGAIYVEGPATLLAEGCSFLGNAVNASGGAIKLAGTASLAATSCTFLGNRASRGGADVAASFTNDLTLTGCSIAASSPTVLWDRMAPNCFVGEALDGNGICQRCAPGTFSLNASGRAARCDVCPPNAACAGGVNVRPLAGFWHSHENSTLMHACPARAACLDGGTCAPGYSGRLCGSCAANHASAGPFQCRECGSTARTLALLVASLVALTCITALSIHLTWRDNTSSNPEARLRPADVLKVWLLWLQVLTILGNLSVPWPASLAGLLAQHSGARWLYASALGQSAPLQCLLPHLRTLPPAGTALLLQLCMPFAIATLLLVCFVAAPGLLAVCCRRCHSTATPVLAAWHKVPCVLLVSLFMFFPALVKACLSWLACLRLDDPSRTPYPQFALAAASNGYWALDTRQECWVGLHGALAWGVGVAGSILFCVVAPAGVWLLLVTHRTRLGKASFRMHCGFLYRNHTPQRWWWEVVSMAQLVCLVATSVFQFSLGTTAALWLTACQLVAGLELLHRFRPSRFARLHQLQLASFGCLLVTTLVALFLSFQSATATGSPGVAPGVPEALSALALAANAAFVAWCIWSACELAVDAVAAARAWLQRAATRALPACCSAADRADSD